MKIRDLVLTAAMLAVSTAPAIAEAKTKAPAAATSKPAKPHKEKVAHVKKAKKAAPTG